MKLKHLLSAGVLFVCSSIAAAQGATPSATLFESELLPDEQVEEVTLSAIDLDAVRQEDIQREGQGLAPRYAIPNLVSLSPFNSGSLELVGDDTLVWRLRVHAPLAASINLGFGQYRMPKGGQLFLYSRDRSQVIRPFTAADNKAHGELWSPLIFSQEMVVELTLPVELFDDGLLGLELTQIGYGYRGFGAKDDGAQESGSCNVDVVCPDGDDWRQEIPSVAVYSTGGSTFCTGFMVNNTANDRTPFFMTADHCGIGAGNAASLVVFWNFETSTCGGTPNGLLNQFQTGATHLASRTASDFTLVLLDDDPNSAWGVTFSGWDRSGADAPGAIAIHHPNTDEKAISFENQPTTTTSYLANSVPGDGTHVRVEDWDTGTTEPGSSGSPLFDPSNRVIGQLHGGFAACGNNSSDWYGKFSVSWDAGTTPSTRLADWLDPIGSGAMTVDTLGTGLSVSPLTDVAHDGPVGGPFTFASTFYTLSNTTATPIPYSVSLTNDSGWELDGGTSPVNGVLGVGGSVQVEVTLGAAAAALASGNHAETIQFDDLSNGLSFTVDHTLEVGRTTIYTFDMSTDPGWSTDGAWAFGVPLGQGGLTNGFPDPTAGATGSNVYGYNLAGDYTDNMPEQHLISTAVNCTGASGVKVRFMRWLNSDSQAIDHAFFRASSDGVKFGRVWSNSSVITDSGWVMEEYDISAIADGQATVYLRWTQGVTDASGTFSGWNIDDVEISAVSPADFQNYGAGLAGTGGSVPTLTGSGGTADSEAFSIDLANGLGGASSILFVGLDQASLPAFGGTFHVDNAVLTLNRKLSGLAGVAGAGGFSLGGSFSDPTLVGQSVFLQAVVIDAGAAQGLALSEGLHLFVSY